MYAFDIFLSHSSNDKKQIREFARKLKEANLSVWYDEWAIKPGDDIYAAIEKGLEESEVLILFMSTSAFSSDWVSLEKNTTIFRDPMNKTRRFMPVLLEECILPDTIRRYKYISAIKSIDEAIQEIIAYFPEKKLKLSSPPSKRELWKEAKEKSSMTATQEIGTKKQDIDHKSTVFETLNSLSQKYRKEKRSSYLFYIDIDGFTLINSQYGDESGDLILGKISKILNSILEKHFFEIWGADEFICCLSDTSKQEVINLSNNIVESVAKYDWKEITPDLYVTVSLGISKLSHKKIEEGTEFWFERAIIGSYYAKRAGGNCCKDGPEMSQRDAWVLREATNYKPIAYLTRNHGS